MSVAPSVSGAREGRRLQRHEPPHRWLDFGPGRRHQIHKSLDGTRVTNYAQWRSREHFEAMLADPVARTHMTEAGELASRFEPELYEVAFSDG